MKKFLRHICTVCKRTTDRQVDNVRVTPDKCTITFKCEGRLIPIQYLSNGGITTAPEVGIVDWRARGTLINGLVQDQELTFLDTSTGSTQQIVLAVQLSASPPADSTLVLNLNQRSDTPKDYKQYVFRFESSFSTVSGVESGIEKKALRYSTSDTVEVFLNGVQLEHGTGPNDYQLYDGTSSSAAPPNTISFNSTIPSPGVTQVDVIISTAATTNTIPLTFKRNVYDESRVTTGAWENVDYVENFNGTSTNQWYLFTLDLGSAGTLNLNTILTASTSATLNGITNVPSNNIQLLLARKPYSILDRYTNVIVPLISLTFERDYLKYFVVDNAPVLYVTETAKATVYPPLNVIKFMTEKTIQTALAGVENQIVVDGSVIIGPDA